MLSFNPITVDNYAAFFNRTPVGRASDYMMARHKTIHFSWLGSGLLVCCLAHRGSTGVFSFAPELVSYWAPRDLHRRAAYSFCESSFLINHGIYHDLFVCS